MKSILTIIAAVATFGLGACATSSKSTKSCCAATQEKKCTDGTCKVDGHQHAAPMKKKK